MKNKGFSFVELIVAVAILGIVSLPIASSFVLPARIEAKAAILTKLNHAADDVLLLVTESEYMDQYGTTIPDTQELYDVHHILQEVYSPSLLSDVSTEVPGEGEPYRYSFSYNNYVVKLTLTPCTDFYRVDIVIDHEANGSTYHVTRKGVLSYAA